MGNQRTNNEGKNIVKKRNNTEDSGTNISVSMSEEKLKEWQAELAEKEKTLNQEKIRISKADAELQAKLHQEESATSLKISEMYKDAAAKLAEKQQKEKEEFHEELEQKRKKFYEDQQDKLDALDAELANRRSEDDKKRELEKSNFKKELEEQKKNALVELEMEINERTRVLTEKENKVAVELERINNRDEEISKREQVIEEEKENLEDTKKKNEREKRRLDRERQRIEEANDDLEKVVAEKIADTIKTHQMQIEAKEKELDNLRTELNIYATELDIVKSFKDAYGDDPAVIRQKIKELGESNKELRDKLANCSDKSEVDRLTSENRDLKERVNISEEENRNLNENREQYAVLLAKYKALEVEYKSQEATVEILNNLVEEKDAKLIRLSAPETRLADREERIKALKQGILDDSKDLVGAGLPNEIDEIKWLEGIRKKCSDFGVPFQQRILYAFHTALKINDWSTITVLAGVSGTGKSELPRLYSAFGGLNFIPVAVQPNWDSQESMLGFFNSIDNRFEPEPLLRFLVQCTEDERYSKYMSIVLLDEMNLAYVEHYFAEFLSKLETRRSLKKSETPNIEVKLGAGVEPYKLSLSRSVLWTGTMNQDETTKSLSDKVLDRGVVINFPRPKKLESRDSMKLLSDFIDENRPMMTKKTWSLWTPHDIEFSDAQREEIKHYREIVEEINNCLEEVGRALGHRVWQSIEYYIANYPLVRQAMKYELGKKVLDGKERTVMIPRNEGLTGELKAAMKIAFEDQIVQKIMPKLRGIETRGRGRNSLQKIEDLLEKEGFENLKDDFEIACEQGYGQFMWSSAKYLGEAETIAEEVVNNTEDGNE